MHQPVSPPLSQRLMTAAAHVVFWAGIFSLAVLALDALAAWADCAPVYPALGCETPSSVAAERVGG